jgi:hypothetical protein
VEQCLALVRQRQVGASDNDARTVGFYFQFHLPERI